jgi:histidine ammonia-lyase
MTLILDNRFDIDLDAVERVAWRGETVELSSNAIARMTTARRNFMNLIETPNAVIYGVTTGYGQNARYRLNSAERLQHASRPPNAAAASWGEPFPERIVRAVILARLANFLDGYSAVSPAVAQAVGAMLSAKSLPTVPSRGHGGAGEILALSHLFHDLASTHPMAEKDVLCLINGSPVASALVADAALAGHNRLELTASVFALAAEGFNVPLSHFAEELDTLWNKDHDAWALRFLRSRLATADDGGRRPYQAPVSFRILPRMLGLARRAVQSASEIAQESLSAVTDNPVILPPPAKYPVGMAISTGGYHNPYAVMAMDQVTSACANLCVIAAVWLQSFSMELFPFFHLNWMMATARPIWAAFLWRLLAMRKRREHWRKPRCCLARNRAASDRTTLLPRHRSPGGSRRVPAFCLRPPWQRLRPSP